MEKNSKLDKLYVGNNVFSNYLRKCYTNDDLKKKHKLDDMKDWKMKSNYLLENMEKIKDEIELSSFEYKFLTKNKELLMSYSNWMNDLKSLENKSKSFSNDVVYKHKSMFS